MKSKPGRNCLKTQPEDTKQYSKRSDEQRHLAAAFGNLRRSCGNFWELTGPNKYQEYRKYHQYRSTTSTWVPQVQEYHEYHDYHEYHKYRVPVGTNGYQWVPVGSSGYQWVPVGTSGYQWVPVGTRSTKKIKTQSAVLPTSLMSFSTAKWCS